MDLGGHLPEAAMTHLIGRVLAIVVPRKAILWLESAMDLRT